MTPYEMYKQQKEEFEEFVEEYHTTTQVDPRILKEDDVLRFFTLSRIKLLEAVKEAEGKLGLSDCIHKCECEENMRTRSSDILEDTIEAIKKDL